MKTYILLIEAENDKGLEHKISGLFYKYILSILDNEEFVNNINEELLFKRAEFTGLENDDDYIKFLCDLYELLPSKTKVQLIEKAKKQIVVLCTKEHHCLGDLLIRNEFGDFNAEIKAVISNYEILEPLVKKFNIPYYFITHENKSKEQHEDEILDIVYKYNPEYIILAKYMRILSPNFVSKYPNRIINIHHSFLPAFIGANPYKQAYDRGVKIIGATSHFVTNDLDMGPIIAQKVMEVDHRKTPKQLAHHGKELERMLLAKALELAFDDRIFVTGNKTVVFE